METAKPFQCLYNDLCFVSKTYETEN